MSNPQVYMQRPQAAVGEQRDGMWVMTLADGTTKVLSQQEFEQLYMPLPQNVSVEITIPGDDEDPEC